MEDQCMGLYGQYLQHLLPLLTYHLLTIPLASIIFVPRMRVLNTHGFDMFRFWLIWCTGRICSNVFNILKLMLLTDYQRKTLLLVTYLKPVLSGAFLRLDPPSVCILVHLIALGAPLLNCTYPKIKCPK